ncbi:putative pectinesterase [Lupinus albus]|uniref:Putative pectinesterase n=1 Tax=Lupinus albus TaxID=3870 RepID=A0A6A4NC75_LUPAL|nr:putative pectinesterase [Lupinus albus]
MAKDLTIQNTAGPITYQAVAFKSDSDLSIIENCEFLGNQDTLYAHSLRQFYKSCHIQGNVDFIFGNSAAVFQDCVILVRPRQENPEKGESNAITAHGRSDPAQATGFVFHNCLINGTDKYLALYHSNPNVHKNFLGRPWRLYSRTGWLPWKEDFALKTLYYGEFENSGPGSDLSQRVPWSNKVPSEHVLAYSAQNFIQGNTWIPPSLLSSNVIRKIKGLEGIISKWGSFVCFSFVVTNITLCKLYKLELVNVELVYIYITYHPMEHKKFGRKV